MSRRKSRPKHHNDELDSNGLPHHSGRSKRRKRSKSYPLSDLPDEFSEDFDPELYGEYDDFIDDNDCWDEDDGEQSR